MSRLSYACFSPILTPAAYLVRVVLGGCDIGLLYLSILIHELFRRDPYAHMLPSLITTCSRGNHERVIFVLVVRLVAAISVHLKPVKSVSQLTARLRTLLSPLG